MKCEDDYSELIRCYLFNLLFKNFLFILAMGKLTNKIEVANDQMICNMDLYVAGKHSVFDTNIKSQYCSRERTEIHVGYDHHTLSYQ